MNHDEFSRCLALVSLLWPQGTRHWTADAMEAWEGLLLDLHGPLLLATIQAIATEGREFPPPPGLLRRRALELANRLPSADEAWGEVLDRLHRVGSTRGMATFSTESGVIECHWSHPLIGEVADRMGWSTLCASENVVADRARFIGFWTSAVERQRVKEHMPPLAAGVLAETGGAGSVPAPPSLPPKPYPKGASICPS